MCRQKAISSPNNIMWLHVVCVHEARFIKKFATFIFALDPLQTKWMWVFVYMCCTIYNYKSFLGICYIYAMIRRGIWIFPKNVFYIATTSCARSLYLSRFMRLTIHSQKLTKKTETYFYVRTSLAFFSLLFILMIILLLYVSLEFWLQINTIK